MPKILSTTGRPKFLSRASSSIAWCQWCHSGVWIDPPQHREADAHVGVLEEREQRDEHRHAGEHAAAVAEHEQRHDRERLGERRVERVEPARRDPVHLLDAVVHGVEAPEQRHRVREPVTPVVADEHEHRPRARPHARSGRQPSRSKRRIQKKGIAATTTSTSAPMVTNTLLTRKWVRSVSSPGGTPSAAEREELLQRDEQHEEQTRSRTPRCPARRARTSERGGEGQPGQVAAHPISPHRTGDVHAP